jgi:hypothetical protein
MIKEFPYEVVFSADSAGLYFVRDKRTGKATESYTYTDAKKLANWLNDRAAGYPDNMRLSA